MKIKNPFIVLLLSLLTLSSCGDLFEKKVVKAGLESGRFNIKCELNFDNFSNILKQNISEDLDCLEDSLNIFISIEELGRGGKLSRVALINYLKNNEPDTTTETVNLINSVFTVSHLITGEDPDFISKENVSKILDFARTLNVNASDVYPHTFGSNKPANLALHRIHRDRVERAVWKIKTSLLSIYKPDRGTDIDRVDLLSLITNFLGPGDTETLEKIQGMLFVKKLILGGEEEILTHPEVGLLFNNITDLSLLLLDGIRYEKLVLKQEDLLQLANSDLQMVSKIVFDHNLGDRKDEPLFHMDQLIDGIDRFIENEDSRIGKYRALVKEAKKILTKKPADTILDDEELSFVTGTDFQRIINHGLNITYRGISFHTMYNSAVLNPIVSKDVAISLDPKKFELNFPHLKNDLVEFCRIASTYRFMKGTYEVGNYSTKYYRNAEAFVEISSFEYLIKEFFRAYGSSLSMDVDQITAIMKKFEPELIDIGLLYPRRYKSTSETIALLGSLFQYQSDDNKVLDVDEATEFAISLMTAIKAQNKMYDFYKEKNCEIDQFGRVEPNCFKQNFYQGLCKNYRPYFPRFFEYLGANSNLGCNQNFNSQKNQVYLLNSIQAARTCHVYPDDNQEIWYAKGDIMSTLLAMMHIETTIIRWDKNLNNYMDSDEVMDAYAIYKPAITGMLPEIKPPFNKKWLVDFLTEKVYLWLVKYEEAPPGTGGVGAILKKVMGLKKSPAERKTIASILKVIGEQSKKKATKPEDIFDCRWLRDPDHIPRD